MLQDAVLNPFVAKLACGAELNSEDRALLERVSSRSHEVAAGMEIIGDGDRPESVHLVLQGLACRSKMLRGGDRQITALLIPGDFCDLHVAVLGRMDHAIRTLTPCLMVDIPKEIIAEMLASSPAVMQALWWATLVDEAILRQWLVSMGQRRSEQQAAHLFCELLVRLRTVGLTDGDSYHFPLTQEELGDVLGLSIVHTNRTLQLLRTENLIEWKRQRLTIVDFDRLSTLAAFNPDYLHLDRRAPPGDTQPRVGHGVI